MRSKGGNYENFKAFISYLENNVYLNQNIFA